MDQLMQLFTYENFQIVTSFIGSFALLAAATPTKKDDSIVGYITKFIDFLGANVFHAKNK